MKRITPPGATLLDWLEERGVTQATLARGMGRPLKTINEIVKGKCAIKPKTALELEKATGIEARFWLHREADYQLDIAKRKVAPNGRKKKKA